MTWTLGPISANWSQLLPRLSDQVDQRTWSRSCSWWSPGRSPTPRRGRRIGAIAAGECPRTSPARSRTSSWNRSSPNTSTSIRRCVKDYASNPKAANAVIGHVMKETKGKYNSQEVVEAVKKEIERRKG